MVSSMEASASVTTQACGDGLDPLEVWGPWLLEQTWD